MSYSPGEQIILARCHGIKTIKESMWSEFHGMNAYRFTDGTSAMENEILCSHQTGLAKISLDIRHRIYLATGKIIR